MEEGLQRKLVMGADELGERGEFCLIQPTE